MAELLGTLEQITLLGVFGLGDDAYGRAVLRDVQAAYGTERTITPGAVYVTLDRLEARCLLSSRVDKGTPARGGRVRRFYRLTATGARSLSEARRTLEMMWHCKPWHLEVFS